MSLSKEYLEIIIEREQNNNNIKRIIGIDVEPAVGKNANYLSTVLRYSMQVHLGSGQLVSRNIIVKTLPQAKPVINYVNENNFFENEVKAYKVTRKMKALMEEFHDRRDTLWCEMIDYKPYHQIILEDLQESQFYVQASQNGLDWEHSLFVIKSLARFHAMSLCLIKRSLVHPNYLDPYKFSNKLVVISIFKSIITAMEKTVRQSWGDKWLPLADMLKNACKAICRLLETFCNVETSKFNVIGHGDCWMNNFLFKHVEGTNMPCGIKFVDLQVCYYNSFAWDLTYFIYSSILPSLRREKYNDILKIYHKSLFDQLQFYNYPETELPTLKLINEEMKRINFYGFIVLCSVYPVVISEYDNAFDFITVLENQDKPENGVDINMFNSLKYRKMVEEDFINFMKGDLKSLLEEYSND